MNSNHVETDEDLLKIINEKVRNNFPFEPYNIQVEFSSQLYKAIESKKIAILESPTGTGKTLSIICGAFQWLQENQHNYNKLFQNKQNQKIQTEAIQQLQKQLNLPDWILKTDIDKEKEQYEASVRLKLEQIRKKQQMMQKYQTQTGDLANNDIYRKKKGKGEVSQLEEKDQFKNFEIKYDEDQDLEESHKTYMKQDQEQTLPQFKLIYASKTHSQIAQFVNEINKTKFSQIFKVLTLSSRNHLCLAKEAKQLQGLKLTEMCKQKQEDGNCSFYSKLKREETDFEFLFFYQDKVQDVEEMKVQSNNCGICPYYLSKQSVKHADIICLPYVSLIDKNTRSSLGISLEHSIIIVDEAHNLLEASNQIFSKEITYRQLMQVIQELQTYFQHYKSRLKAKSQLYIKQLISLAQSLYEFFKTKKCEFESQSVEQNTLKTHEKQQVLKFMAKINLDQYDIPNLQKFIEKTKLAHKIHYFNLKKKKEQPGQLEGQIPSNNKNGGNFAQKQQIQQEEEDENYITREVREISQEPQILQKFIDFLIFCIFEEQENSIILIKSNKQFKDEDEERKKNLEKKVANNKHRFSLHSFSLQLLNLNCFSKITSLIEEAHCMILAGGTMEPLSEFEILVEMIGRDKFLQFSCEHVIPQENLATFIISNFSEQWQQGYRQFKAQDQLIYNYESKKNLTQKRTLYEKTSSIILELSAVVPDGLIVFLQSYQCVKDLQPVLKEKLKLLNSQSYMEQGIKLFFDGQNCQNILSEYSECIQKKQKCILFSVMGGKLSEGINFKDEMARGIVVCGLPFPNKNAPDLQEKMKFFDSNCYRTSSQSSSTSLSGNGYYNNLCMKQVNQTIGRCIRHKNDYSVIYLVDARFQNKQIQQGLPGWVRPSIQKEVYFEEMIESTKLFFRNKIKNYEK